MVKHNIQVSLLPTLQQVDILHTTMKRVNEACNVVSKRAYELQYFHPVKLHKLKSPGHKNFYHCLRASFPELQSVMINSIFGRVASVYSNTDNRSHEHVFEPNDEIVFNRSTLRLNYMIPDPLNCGLVSLSTVAGRRRINFLFSNNQSNPWLFKNSEIRLKYHNGNFFLLFTIPE